MTDLVKSIRIVQDPMNRSPGHQPVDIVEVEFSRPPGDEHFAWADVLRFRCERGHADDHLVALGLKQPEHDEEE